MACQDCNPPGPVTHFPYPPTLPCGNGGQDCDCGVPAKASCVENDGLPLACIGAARHERMDSILQKIDQRLCEVTGGDSYDSYNLRCLAPVSTQKDFAEKVALTLCTLNSGFSAFTTSTFPAKITELTTQITDLDKAGFVYNCPLIDIAEEDSLSTSLYKLSAGLCQLRELATDVSGANWDACTTVSTPPATIQEGFDFLISWICTLGSGSGGGTLPVFDNTGSCLESPTQTDSLEGTVIKIRTRLCSTPTFSLSSLTAGCVSFTGISTLEQLLGRMLAQIDLLSKNSIRGADAGQFAIADADPASPCSGKKLSLSGPVSTDRLVAVDAADLAPGTLEEKLHAGAGILFSTEEEPGKLSISAPPSSDELVKVGPDDSAAGYLQDKLIGKIAEVSIAVNPTADDKLEISAPVNYQAFIDRLFDIIETDPDVKARFCNLMSGCPSPCDPPTNVEAVAVP